MRGLTIFQRYIIYESSESIRLVAEVGSQYATLHASAVGKVFLAYMDEIKFNSFLKNKDKIFFKNQIISNKEEHG